MTLTYQQKYFICRTSYEDRLIPKKIGFIWSIKKQVWYTSNARIASGLSAYADEKAKREINRIHLNITPWTEAIPHNNNPIPYDFQILDAVPFALSRNRSYLALDPGLGKTLCACLIANALKTSFVYICPPFLMKNVEAEIKRSYIGKRYWALIPDTMLHRQKEYLQGNQSATLFVDEAHRFKNEKARRTKSLFETIIPKYSKVVFLSGTPMPNRPIELYEVLSQCAPETIDFMSRHEYALKYCNAFENMYGWDYSGASNVEELSQKILGKFMRRIRKEEVLKELPPKTEELIFIDDKMPKTLASFDKKTLKKYSPEDLTKHEFNTPWLATYRRQLGVVKVPAIAKYVDFLLESTEESILLFAIHKEVINLLKIALKKYFPLVITGNVPTQDRQLIVDKFQHLPLNRLLIMNIQAGGVGFNLTKASRVVFGEFSWSPSENDQASDRAHRIGQKDSVNVNYLVYEHSLDAVVLQTIFRKKESQKHI